MTRKIKLEDLCNGNTFAIDVAGVKYCKYHFEYNLNVGCKYLEPEIEGLRKCGFGIMTDILQMADFSEEYEQ